MSENFIKILQRTQNGKDLERKGGTTLELVDGNLSDV